MAPMSALTFKANVQVAARRVTIDILPEEVLLEIFDHYVDPTRRDEAWCTLVHVCRNWRNIVLGSPRRLNLRIHCYPTTNLREMDIWPDLPIVLGGTDDDWEQQWDVATVFEQNNRMCQICLEEVPTSQMGKILAEMHKPFPALTDLTLDLTVRPEDSDETLAETLVDPDLFLGGSAPCLQYLRLDCIPFPRLPKLLSTATHLTDLQLTTKSRYISPEAMASCLSVLTKLETLILEFEPFESFPVREYRHSLISLPPTRILLPALTVLYFKGASEYLEDLVVRIDTPLLDDLAITLPRMVTPDTAQLARFINRAPKLKVHDSAHVDFYGSYLCLTLGRLYEKGLEITYEVGDRQVSFAAQVCTSSLAQAFGAIVEHLYMRDYFGFGRRDIPVVETDHWLQILRPFTSVKSLYLSRAIVPRIAPALQELHGERVAGVLPALTALFLKDPKLSGPAQEAIGLFVSQRQSNSLPIVVSPWE